MESNNKKNVMKIIKILTIILLIILVSIISFFGIYKQNGNQMSNMLKKYSYAMDINGARTINLKVNTEKKEIIKDSEGNIIEEATDEEIKQKGYVKEEVLNNSKELLVEENYKKSKEIIEKRLKKLQVENYNISLNKTTGQMDIEIPEDAKTDAVISSLTSIGKFEIIDTETKQILMDNSNIKSSNILYNTTSTGTTVYLEIDFNKDGKKKLEEITKTYIKEAENNETTNETKENNIENSTVENNNETNNSTSVTNNSESEGENSETKAEKTITMKIDDEEIMTTSFDEPIITGKIQLSVGTATTDTKTLKDYISQAQNVSIILNSGKLPIKYDINRNEYILSNITEKDLTNIKIAIAIISVIGILILIAKYKTNGLLAGFSYVGLTALYTLLIRYTNVTISIESIFGIISMLILNYIFTVVLLNNINKISENKKENVVNKATLETYIKFFIRIIPLCIMVIAFCFIRWIPLNSFGMISFWGIVLIAIYNAIITRILLKIKSENK